MREIRKVLILALLLLALVEIGRTKSIEKDSGSAEHGSKSGEKDPKHHEHGHGHGHGDEHDIKDGSHSSEHGSKGDKHGSKSSEHGSHNSGHGSHSSEHGSKSGEHGSNSAGHSSENGGKSSEENHSAEDISHKLKITPIVGPFTHAEGPHWDHLTQKLYFVDIVEQKIHKFDPKSQSLTSAYIKDGPVGFVIPVNDMHDKFVAGVGRDFSLITWDSDKSESNPSIRVLTSVDADQPGNRWNDGKADSSGRFWGGTIGPEVNEVVEPNKAALYKITKKLIPHKEISSVTNSNGLAWNIEDNTFYYIDTGLRQIAAYDYDAHSGTISNRRIVFDFVKNNIHGFPDGMTIDAHGHLYVAVFTESYVVKIDPLESKLLSKIVLPAKKVTSVSFGGPLLDILYVTTSARDLSAEELEQEPYAGYVFAVEGLQTNGLHANSFKLCE